MIGRLSTRFDLALAAVMLTIAVVEVFLAPPDADPLAVLLPGAIALAAPLIVRRTHPLVCLALVLAVMGILRLALGEIWDAGSSLAIPMIAAYAVAAYTGLRTAIIALVVTVALTSVYDVGADGADVAFVALIFGAIWIAGRMAGRQRALAESNARYARKLEAMQAMRDEDAAREERARIARELHDVVAHCVSTMVVQAEAGQALIATRPERSEESLRAIQETGRQALGELRRMLGLLRDGQATEHEPQPGLGRLDRLLDGVRRAGLAVDVEVRGEPWALTQGLDLTAYRILQESLTNTLKHSGAGMAAVRLVWSAAELDIEVRDQGPSRRPADSERKGHGILGMRERAALHGGELVAASSPGGGYAVRARLPRT